MCVKSGVVWHCLHSTRISPLQAMVTSMQSLICDHTLRVKKKTTTKKPTANQNLEIKQWQELHQIKSLQNKVIITAVSHTTFQFYMQFFCSVYLKTPMKTMYVSQGCLWLDVTNISLSLLQPQVSVQPAGVSEAGAQLFTTSQSPRPASQPKGKTPTFLVRSSTEENEAVSVMGVFWLFF